MTILGSHIIAFCAFVLFLHVCPIYPVTASTLPYLPNWISCSHFITHSSQGMQKQMSRSSSRTTQPWAAACPPGHVSASWLSRFWRQHHLLVSHLGLALGTLGMRWDGRWALHPALKSVAASVIAARGRGSSTIFISIGVQGHRGQGKELLLLFTLFFSCFSIWNTSSVLFPANPAKDSCSGKWRRPRLALCLSETNKGSGAGSGMGNSVGSSAGRGTAAGVMVLTVVQAGRQCRGTVVEVVMHVG